MKDKLTWDEIVKKYPDQWVAILDGEETKEHEFLRGKVACASPDKKELLKATRELGDINMYVRYTGDIPMLIGLSTLEIQNDKAL